MKMKSPTQTRTHSVAHTMSTSEPLSLSNSLFPSQNVYCSASKSVCTRHCIVLYRTRETDRPTDGERERENIRGRTNERSHGLFAQDFRRSLLLYKSCRLKTKDRSDQPERTQSTRSCPLVPLFIYLPLRNSRAAITV